MFVERAAAYLFLPTTFAIVLISFPSRTRAQQCHTAHDPSALKALQERAASGDADAECGLGKQYEFALGVPQDNKQATLWLRKSADQGDIAAQVELGVVFDKMQDYAQALIWYRKAADQGNARAEYNLALAYQNGEAVPKDMTQALAWYRKAADQGDMIAQLNLGVMYEHGEGVPQDYLQAAELYRKSADQGLAEAQYGLGFLYLHGKGVPKDAALASSWLLKAAEQGEIHAQYNLGACYATGDCADGAGVDKDLSEGYFWAFLANARTTDGDLKGYAETLIEKLDATMKKGDIKNAQKRAEAWLKAHPPRVGP